MSLPDLSRRQVRLLLCAVVVLAAAVPIAMAAAPSDREAPPPAKAAVPRPASAPLPYPVPETPPDQAPAAAGRFVAPDGNDAGECTADAPCATFDRAYHAAAPGDVVEVASGTYEDQIMTRARARTSDEDVTFRPADGAAVTVAGLTFGQWNADVGAEHVEFRDMTVESILARRSDDLTFRNLTMTSFWIEGGHGIRFVGGSVGGIKGANPWIGTWRGEATGKTETPTDVVVDGVDFHDIRMKNAEDHIECLHINDVIRFAVRNSHFHDCDTFDLLVMYGYEEVLKDIVIENNVFEPSQNSFGGPAYFSLSLRFGTNVTVRNNTSTQAWAGPDAGGGPIAGTWTIANNIFPTLQTCPEGIDYTHNLWIGGANVEQCGPSDLTATDPGLAGAGDFRPAAGSPAVDAGDPRHSTGADIEGRPRPQGPAPDIGAYER